MTAMLDCTLLLPFGTWPRVTNVYNALLKFATVEVNLFYPILESEHELSMTETRSQQQSTHNWLIDRTKNRNYQS